MFEIAKTASGYASTPATLVSFNGADGAISDRRLIADANGDLFGTTEFGGASDDGTVFEIVKTAGGYASTPTTLVSFNGADGSLPTASLLADSNGDLFGTTTGLDPTRQSLKRRHGIRDCQNCRVVTRARRPRWSASTAPMARPRRRPDRRPQRRPVRHDLRGGATAVGTVFEIKKTGAGYASTPTTLVNFNGADGAIPEPADCIADSNGDLFGTTSDGGGANGDGTVFEIKKTAAGYASTPTTLVSFNGANGSSPRRV